LWRGKIDIPIEVYVAQENPSIDLFYFTEYGLSKLPADTLYSIEYIPTAQPNEFKKHHGVDLHYTCYAYIGDLREKKTWKLPYRNSDNTIDSKRIDKAVNYLLSPAVSV